MKRRLILMALVIAGPASASGYDAKAGGACLVYAMKTNRMDVATNVGRLAKMFRRNDQTVLYGRIFVDKINREAMRDRSVAAYQFVKEGRAGCAAIGVM